MPNDFRIERQRIDDLLSKSLDYSTVLLVAGEGFGKTYAVESFLRRKNKDAIWISLSERDNDPDCFWETVSNAVGLREADAGKALKKTGFPRSHDQIVKTHAALQNTETDRKKYVVVVDNCQYIQDESIIKISNQILEYPFPKETTILISRTEPNLNAMTLLSKGLLFRINLDDFRFNREESSEYFRMMDINLSPEETEKIYTDTEGWLLGLKIIAEDMKKIKARYSHSIIVKGAFWKKEEAVFASVPLQCQRLLVIFSLFEQCPLEVALAIVDTVKDAPPKDERSRPFLNSLSAFFYYDANLHGFKFHKAFLDFLREQQHDLSPEEVKAACAINAQWCMENNLYIEAAASCGIAGDYRGILKAIYSFPRHYSRVAAASMLKILDRVLNKRSQDDEDYILLKFVTRAGMLLNLGSYDECRKELVKSLEKFEALPPSPLSSMILSTCYNTMGALSVITYRITGDLSRIYDYFARGNYYRMRYPYEVSGPMTKTSIGSYAILTGTKAEAGAFEKFIDTIALCIPHTSYSMGGHLSGMDSLCRAELAFFKGDLNNAEMHALEAIPKAREKGQYEIESKCLFYLLRIYLCEGNASAFRETWDQMEVMIDKVEYLNRYIMYDIITGWFFAHIEEVDLISPWLRNKVEESDLNLHVYDYETMVKAKSMFAEKQYSEALDFLESKGSLESSGEGLDSLYFGLLEITALKSVIQYRIGNVDAALKLLESAYNLAAINAFDMPFIELGEDMRDLAETALNHASYKPSKKDLYNNGSKKVESWAIPRAWLESIKNKSSVYTKKLIAVAEQYQNDRSEEKRLFLTSQELSILTSISHGFTREEIAANALLSVNTVKSIIKTIYAKLGSFNRADAIRIASNMGILK